MLYDPEIEVRVRVLSALAHSGNFYEIEPAVEVLNQFLADKDPERRAHAIQILGEVGDVRAIKNLADYLDDPADAVRLATAVAVESLTKIKLSDDLKTLIVERISPLLQDPVERVRQATLNVLGQLGDYEAYKALVGALTDPSPQVRATAVDALVEAGKAVVPIVHPQFDSPNPQLRKMATMILSRINLKEYGPLVNTHVTSNLLTIYQNYSLIDALAPCALYPSIAVLQSALREQNDQLVAEIFYLLTAIHDADDVKIVADSLHSDSQRVRANAAEALESLTTPQTAQLVVPLFDPQQTIPGLIAISREVWDMKRLGTAQAIKQLIANPDTPWLRAIVTFALGEMGESLSLLQSENGHNEPPEANLPEDKKAAPEGSKRRRTMAKVLGALEETPQQVSKTTANKSEKRKARRSVEGLWGALADKEEIKADTPDNKTGRRRTRRPPGDLLGVLTESSDKEKTPVPPLIEPVQPTAPSIDIPFTFPEIEAMIEHSFADDNADVRLAARAAKRIIAGFHITDVRREEVFLLSTIEKIIFLKEVPFFQGMTIYQLEVLANISEEKFFAEDERIFNENDSGGALYVIVNGRVGIEQERRKGSYARLATLGPRTYFGETSLFDNSPRSSSAIAVQDTLTLRVRREPMIALSRQYPDLSLELINVLSNRLREANDRIAELTRTRPRELQKLFDKFD
jgi:HEAT repeat protein